MVYIKNKFLIIHSFCIAVMTDCSSIQGSTSSSDATSFRGSSGVGGGGSSVGHGNNGGSNNSSSCSRTPRIRIVRLCRPNSTSRRTLISTQQNTSFGFAIRGGREFSIGFFVSRIEKGSEADLRGLRVIIHLHLTFHTKHNIWNYINWLESAHCAAFDCIISTHVYYYYCFACTLAAPHQLLFCYPVCGTRKVGDQIIRVNGYLVDDAVHRELSQYMSCQDRLTLKVRGNVFHFKS